MTSQHPDHESNTLSGILDGPLSPTPPAIPSDKPSGPTFGTRLIIFSALVLPSALIPLLVLRRRVNNLHREVDELRVATRDLHLVFKYGMSELSSLREQHGQLLSETRSGLKRVRGEMYRRRIARVRYEERIQGQVQEVQASNQAQISRLRELGTSLADVAAFMQEMELQQGFSTPRFDGNRIERLRFLAMQFEGLEKANAADPDKSGVTDKLRRD